ncbi:MAG TPA: ROK family protein [Firmicutes bacterium]|nr:ROK family protein [Bacillota bacterium]
MVIGIDLGGMSAKAALLSGAKLEGKSRVVTSADVSAEKTAFALAELAVQTAEKAGKSMGDVQAIGIGAPGVIDSADGVIVSWTNFGWKHVPLGALVEKYTGKKTFVLNDANAAALGEAKFGAGKEYSDSVLVTLGTGVGSGIMIGGKLFEGFRSAGAELGHTVIRVGGEQCSCGRRGCFERYASASALIRLTQKGMRLDRGSAMWRFAHTPEEVDGRTVFLAMKEGDSTAQRVFDDYIEGLGEGILNIVNTFRPQAIILGGGISAEGETLLEPLRRYVFPRLYVSVDYAPLSIVCASLGNDAGLYGAAQYAFDRL